MHKEHKAGNARNVNVRFVPHGKFAWKLYPHSLLFHHPDSFFLPTTYSPFFTTFLKNGSGCFLALSIFAESLCKSRDVVAKKEVAANSKKQATSVCAVFVVDIDHVDLWASAVSEAFWDATGGFNSTHLDLNCTLLAARLRFSIEALFSVDVWGSKLFWKKKKKSKSLIFLDT